jgi:hypothetical protein
MYEKSLIRHGGSEISRVAKQSSYGLTTKFTVSVTDGIGTWLP